MTLYDYSSTVAFSLLDQSPQVVFAETMHEFACLSDNVWLRIRMENTLDVNLDRVRRSSWQNNH